METYQERMLVELKELGERVDKLHKFIGNRENIMDMPIEKLDLLMRQYHYMTLYEHVLRLRCGMEGIS